MSDSGLGAVGSGRIAIRMPNWLGDAMFAIPAVRAVRGLAPHARLELHARAPVAEVLAALDGLADGVVIAGSAGPRDLWRDAAKLGGAAACVLFPNSLASAIPAWLARVPCRLGATGSGRRLLLTTALAPAATATPHAHYLALVGGGSADAGVVASAASLARGRAMAGTRRFAVLTPGAAHGSAKRWRAAGFKSIGWALRASGLEVLVVGTRDEREVAARVADACGGRNLAGTTRGAELVGLLALAAVVVANDSGALHLAAALGTPVVGLYGATDPAATGPIVGRHRVVFRPAPCTPCGLRECSRPRHDCMDAIEVGEVWTAVRELLAGEPK